MLCAGIMKYKYLAAIGLVASLLMCLRAAAKPEEEAEVLKTSPSGAFRIESKFPEGSAADAIAEVWLVSTKDPVQRAKLPGESIDSPPDDEFYFSPNEEWLFGSRHVASGFRDGHVYHLMSPLRIEIVGERDSFNGLAWKDALRLGAFKKDYGAMGFYAMTRFANWSLDSSRLLIRLCGGEQKHSMLCGFLYFNTRTSKFEVTDYSRKLNKAKTEPLACAEPIDPLPTEAELKQRFDTLDRELNKKYAEVLAKTEKDRVQSLRQGQRKWLKACAAGEKAYLESFPSSEATRRRLQYLGDVTAARIDQPQDQWEW
jgi:uncharacterized protein YecT (DUF1311 family)